LEEKEANLKKNIQEYRDEMNQVIVKYEEKFKPIYQERAQIVEGIPEFWLRALRANHAIVSQITKRDCEILKHLKDIRAESTSLQNFAVEMVFSENPYFSNTSLRRSFELKEDENGEDIVKTNGTEILWKDPYHLRADSFFHLFVEDFPSEDEDNELASEDLFEIYQTHIQTARILKDLIIPHSLALFKKEPALDLIESGSEEESFGEDDEDDDAFDYQDDEDFDEESDEGGEVAKPIKKTQIVKAKKAEQPKPKASKAKDERPKTKENPAECNQQ